MKKVIAERFTDAHEGDVVVFIIGMRVNKWWAVHKWLPVFSAMPGMIKELYINKSLGFLSTEMFFGRTVMLVQYWRSYEELSAYAKGHQHLHAWKNFNRRIGTNGSVGIYHETYIVPKENREGIYVNMPPFGLSKASGYEKITPATATSKKRLATKDASSLNQDQTQP
ncbi:DUF4188 domain-containing protein [Halobacillus litoralis]|uniref:DUF4188 domain-containing protein n=1 Tax=Halobacillus litoralis TaxID=45668 RepID=UPI001CD4266D|nr:DUF4188 domain-containing protein [Halobacillus litoralis]MCA0971694.1 DUF4188 domain-containing protein [Halobacillus litoralis]